MIFASDEPSEQAAFADERARSFFIMCFSKLIPSEFEIFITRLFEKWWISI